MLRSLISFAKLVVRPDSHPYMWRMLRHRLLGRPASLEKTQPQADAWCRKRAVDTATALRDLGVAAFDPAELHADVFAQSHERVTRCPQQMGGGGNLSLLYSLARGLPAEHVIETGVAYGWSSLAILLAMQDSKVQTPRLMSSNLHYPRFDGDDQYVGCAVPASLRPAWTLIPEADQTALPQILAEMPTCDLVHYDSDKSYIGRMNSLPILWEALRVGGLLVSDDISDNVAFQHFCKMLQTAPTVVVTPQVSGVTKYVGVLRKADERVPRKIRF